MEQTIAQKKSPTKTDVGGYLDPARVYIEMAAETRKSAVRMTRLAFAALLVASLSIVGNIYQTQLPRELPYVVREGSNGQTGAGSIMRPAERPDLPWIKYQLARWISESRAVSSDPHIQGLFNAHTALLILNGSPAASTVSAYFQRRSALPEMQRVGVQMNFVRERADSDHVFEADWTETAIDPRGHVLATEHWNALISIAFTAGNVSLPSGDDPDYSNPYGMYISDLNWNREET